MSKSGIQLQKNHYSSSEFLELGIIFLISFCAAFLTDRLPESVSLGEVILFSSIMMFSQSLIRDLWIRFGQKRIAETTKHRTRCMCLESTLGVAILIIGIVIAFSGLGIPLMLSWLSWPILILCFGIGNFLIKDFIIDWKTGQIRRERDHASLVF